MKFILALLLLAVGCEYKKEREFRPGGRDKLTTPKTRLTPSTQTDINTAPVTQTTSSPKAENLIFPIIPSSSHTVFLLKSSDYKKISFSAEPSVHPLSLLAGLSGTVSLKTSNGIYYLSLTPNQGNLILHFELSEAGTTVKTSDQAQVTQNQILMTSNKPILFYTTENSQVSLLCINTSGLEKILTIKKELPNTDKCS